MRQELEHRADLKPRRAARIGVKATTRLTQQNWYSVKVSMCDLSSAGFQARCDRNVPIGGYVTLDVPGIGPVRAQVRWQMADRIGGMFLDPIRLHRCEWTAVQIMPPAAA